MKTANSALRDATDGVQLVVFGLDDRDCALRVEEVREVLRMVAVAPVAGGPQWLVGVLNLRGNVVPVLDLRTRLGLPAKDITLDTPIVVARNGEQLVGVIVERMNDLLTLPAEQVETPEELSSNARGVHGIARVDERLIVIFAVADLCDGEIDVTLDEAA